MSCNLSLLAVEEELPQREKHKRMPLQVQLEIRALQPRINDDSEPTIIETASQIARERPNAMLSVDRESLWGDMMVAGKNQCRVLFNNVQGLTTANAGIEISEIGKEVMENEVTILGMCETNRNWRDKRSKNEIKRRFRDFWKMTSMAVSSSTEHGDRFYQPGGTMTVVGEPWACRAKAAANESDMGRWNEIAISGRKGKSVIVITAYRVCKNSAATAGPTTSFAQQWHILRRSGDKTPDPRKRFIRDLEKRVGKALREKQGVIVMLDANESLQHFNNDFTKWIRNSQLVDIHVHRHGTQGEPTTYTRGSTRIDYMLLSRDLVDYVSAAGILPFKTFTKSDHRALFIDIDLDCYLGGRPSDAALATRRGLASNDPRAVRKYRSELEAFLLKSHIEKRTYAKIKEIERSSGGLTKKLALELNALEAEFSKGKLEAEVKCAKVRSVPWSPQLMEMQQRLRFWKYWLSEMRTGICFQQARVKVWEDGAAAFRAVNWATVQEELQCAQKGVKQMLSNAVELRSDHLEERAKMAEWEGNGTVEKIVKRIIKAEQLRGTHKKIDTLLGKNNRSGLTFLLVEKTDGTCESIFNRNEVNKLLIERFSEHFGQADGTPFTKEPLRSLFGPDGSNMASKDLLEGKLDIDSLEATEATKSILRKALYATEPNSVSRFISVEDIRGLTKRWRESTSTSPSGLHLGHDKAVMRDEKPLKNGELDNRLSTRMFRMKAAFINVAFDNNHVYDRWTNIVNATIEKIPGRPLIKKLRIIHLIESDLNMTVGIQVRRLIQKAVNLGLLCREQFGSLPGKQAIDPLALKHSTFSVSRLARANAASVDNDAKSCFDRIVMLLASLIAQRLGMDVKACTAFLKTLSLAKYSVKTAMGISDETYQTTEERTVHGPGQGGRASPGIWAIISCLIMECMPEGSTGITTIDPVLMTVVKYFTSGFVDDVTLWIGNMARSLHGGETPEMILEEAQQAIRWWEALLHSTGGKLELTKCFIYLQFWVYDEEGVARTLSPEEFPMKVVITDSETGAPIELDVRDCTQSHKTLGALECPSGNYNDEALRIREKSRGLGQRIATASLRPHEALLVKNTRVEPALGYSLAVGTMSEEQAHKAQGVVVQPLLQALGFNATTPCAVVYAPLELGGCGFRHLFAEQGATKMRHLLQQIRLNSLVGQNLVIMMQWAQVEAGISKPILLSTKCRLPQLTNEKYITTLRKYLFISGMGLHINAIQPLAIKRVNDEVLMDRASQMDKKHMSDKLIERVNRCRNFLRVETIADVATSDGKYICEHAFACNPEVRVRSKKLWPNQPHVGITHSKSWQWYLKLWCKDGSLELRHPLGKWLVEPTDRGWAAYYNEETDTVLTRNHENWREHKVQGKQRHEWDLSEHHATRTEEEVQRLKRKIPLEGWIYDDGLAGVVNHREAGMTGRTTPY
jgi:hypothetical protein